MDYLAEWAPSYVLTAADIPVNGSEENITEKVISIGPIKVGIPEIGMTARCMARDYNAIGSLSLKHI